MRSGETVVVLIAGLVMIALTVVSFFNRPGLLLL